MSEAGPQPVLFLHGQPGGAGDWSRVIAALGEGVETIAFDRPGWDGNAAPSDLQRNAQAAIAELDARALTRATVVGHSFGAAVACWLAAGWPERVGALVLVAPAANVASLYAIDRVLAAPVVGDLSSVLLLAGPAIALRAGWARRRIATQLGLDQGQLQQAGRAFARRGAWRAFVVEQRALIRDLPKLEPRLGSITAPATVVIGARDRIVPVRSALALATQIPGAQLMVLERVGHLLPLRRADELASAILAAVSGGPAPGGPTGAAPPGSPR